MKTIDFLGLAAEGVKDVGSFGGLIYIVNLIVLFVNRVRVEIRDVQNCSRDTLKVSFEAENLGRSPTSIHSDVNMRCFLPRPRNDKKGFDGKFTLKKYEFALTLEGSERSLPPSSPKKFEAEKRLSTTNPS
jgi:hypothetical protein